MEFKTIHTRYGLNQLVAAEVLGTKINLTHMAVGDGNGNAVTPSEMQTTLVRERYRAVINRVYADPTDATHFTAEMIIPASEGGFTLREVGVFDSDGSLFVVGNLPETYKTEESDGAYSDTVIRVEFKVSNASVITLQIDPNVTVATQSWISNNITAAYLLPGGTTHQVLRKKTNIDGDTEWADPTDVSVTVDMVEETQTLATSQTAVTFSVVTTTGLAIYIDGVRLRADQWEKDGTTPLTKINLAQSYTAGSKLIAVQNEPAGSLPDPLVKSQNLSDVPNKVAARSNLDVPSNSDSKQRGPAGSVVAFAMSVAPTGWLKCNGAAISRTAYADLFAVIGTTWGVGDGFNTFNLPDLRGEFVRGWDDSRGVDGGRVFGSYQVDAFAAHNHMLPISDPVLWSGSVYGYASGQPNAAVEDIRNDVTSTFRELSATTGGTETRPRNRALLYCIKY